MVTTVYPKERFVNVCKMIYKGFTKDSFRLSERFEYVEASPNLLSDGQRKRQILEISEAGGPFNCEE